MRRLWVGLVIVVLIAVALGIWLYFAVFAPAGAALRLAEAFSFRRMTVAQVEPGVYRFFYVTNRNLGVDGGRFEDRFGQSREETLKFGAFDTKIEPNLHIGMLINPTDWFQNEAIQVRDMRKLDRQAFAEQIRGSVQGSPHRALLIVVHGFREAFPSAIRKTAFLGHVLDINVPVLLFDWPGNQGSSLRGYRRAQRLAQESGAELAQTLELIIRDVRPDRLWLVANSMGAQVVVDAFSLLYEKPYLADAETEIEDVVLTAPDVDAEKFNQRFKQEIKALATHLTAYVSSNDRALLMSRLVNWRQRRGESTLNPDQLDEAARLSGLIDPDSQRITLIDVTPVNRTRNFHNFSLETPEFFDDLYLRLTNPWTPRHRLLYPVKTPDGAIYWILTRGR